jgi:cytochrome c oxidase cbb3-type subunit IV
MDLNDLRSGVTVLAFLAFVALVVWVWGKGRSAGFEEAARLPLVDGSAPAADAGGETPGGTR